MDGIGELLGLGASVASGGLFGFLSAGVGAIGKFFQAKEAHKQKIELMEWDIRMFDKQMESKKLETEMEIAVTSSEGAWTGLHDSILADKALAKNSPEWVNGIKSLFRPFLTTALTGSSVWMIVMVWDSVMNSGGEESSLVVLFTEAEIKDLLKYMIYSLFFATTTSIVWWFGDRAFAPPHLKNR